MKKALVGVFVGGLLGGVAGEFFGTLHLHQAILPKSTDLLADILLSLARLTILTGGCLGAIAGAIVGASGDITDAIKRIPKVASGA